MTTVRKKSLAGWKLSSQIEVPKGLRVRYQPCPLLVEDEKGRPKVALQNPITGTVVKTAVKSRRVRVLLDGEKEPRVVKPRMLARMEDEHQPEGLRARDINTATKKHREERDRLNTAANERKLVERKKKASANRPKAKAVVRSKSSKPAGAGGKPVVAGTKKSGTSKKTDKQRDKAS